MQPITITPERERHAAHQCRPQRSVRTFTFVRPTIWKPKDISSGITWGNNGFLLIYPNTGGVRDPSNGQSFAARPFFHHQASRYRFDDGDFLEHSTRFLPFDWIRYFVTSVLRRWRNADLELGDHRKLEENVSSSVAEQEIITRENTERPSSFSVASHGGEQDTLQNSSMTEAEAEFTKVCGLTLAFLCMWSSVE